MSQHSTAASGIGRLFQALMNFLSGRTESVQASPQVSSTEILKPQLYKHYSEIPDGVWRWPNFTPKEIACKGSGEILIDPHALDLLQLFREKLGVPFTPNSAYRSMEHNKRVGGSENSMHMHGRAFDVPIKKGMTAEKIKKAARMVGFTGIGHYNTFVHIDTGAPRYWDLRKPQ